MNKLFILFLYLFIISCDTMDKRIHIYNATKDSLIVRMMFDSDLMDTVKNIHNRNRVIILGSNDTKGHSVFPEWEGQFNMALPSKEINVIVMKFFDYNSDSKKWDSLYATKNYFYKKYSLRDLKKKDWLIKYPDDGFSIPN